MKIRLCKGCKELADNAGNIEVIKRLIEKGAFFCVYGKPECGKKLS